MEIRAIVYTKEKGMKIINTHDAMNGMCIFPAIIHINKMG